MNHKSVTQNTVLFQLLSLYSQVLRDLFASAQKGVVEELPVVKLEDESATDIRTLLDLLYPDNYQVVNGMYLSVNSQGSVKKHHKSISVPQPLRELNSKGATQ